MQKKIITLAIAAAVSSPAFAEIAPYGIADGAIVSVSAKGQKSDLLAYSGGLSGSRLGVKATEDLGDGLTGLAVLEYALDTETNQTQTGASVSSTNGSNLYARQQLLGVAGSFGTVATGFLQTSGYDFGSKFDPVAGSAVSPLQSVTKGAQTFLIGTSALAARAQRAVAYISPVFNGLSFAVNYSTAISGLGDLTLADNAAYTSQKTSASLFSASYAKGALVVGTVYASASNYHPVAGVSVDVSEYALGGSYDLGVAKLFGTYQASKISSLSKEDLALSLSGVIPVGDDAVALSYAENHVYSGNGNGKGFTLGYLHNMSKTTTLYAAYHDVTNASGTSKYSVIANAVASSTAANWTAGGGGSSLVAVGLRKKF